MPDSNELNEDLRKCAVTKSFKKLMETVTTEGAHKRPVQWSVAIFAARETIEMLGRTVAATVRACGDTKTSIEVLVNGNLELARAAITQIESVEKNASTCQIRLWFIQVGDKAHAWNQFLYHIACPSSITFFVDGYVQVWPSSFTLIEEGLQKHPNAIAATGVPTVGRTAKSLRAQMLKSGGIHGNLYAIRGHVLDQLRDDGFHLPLGLYRTDGLLGAMFNYNMRPSEFQWDTQRVLVHPDCSWDLFSERTSIIRRLLVQSKRILRQHQGELENLAIRNHFSLQRRRPNELPTTIAMLVQSWMAAQPKVAANALKNPFARLALRKLEKQRNWGGVELPPVLLAMNVRTSRDPQC